MMITISSLLGEGPPEQQDVLLRPVEHVVHPAQALLDAQVPPLRLGHQVRLRHELGEVPGEHHVAVLELVVSVLVAVVDVLLRHSKI